MAHLDYVCDVRQGFNFEKDVQNPVGFVTALTVCGQKLDADITVTDPLKIDAGKLKVVGVLSTASWLGGYADPLYVAMQVSGANKNVLSSLVHQKLSNTKLAIRFVVYQFDQEAKDAQYFKAFHSNDKDLECLIEKGRASPSAAPAAPAYGLSPGSSSSSMGSSGSPSVPLSISVATEPDGTVQSPRNYTVMLGAVPQEKAQELHLAVGLGKCIVKRFGIEVKK